MRGVRRSFRPLRFFSFLCFKRYVAAARGAPYSLLSSCQSVWTRPRMYARTVLFTPNSAQLYAIWGHSCFFLLFYKSEEEEGKKGAESHHVPPPRVCYRIVQRPLFCNHLSLLYLSREVTVSLSIFAFFCARRPMSSYRISPPVRAFAFITHSPKKLNDHSVYSTI